MGKVRIALLLGLILIAGCNDNANPGRARSNQTGRASAATGPAGRAARLDFAQLPLSPALTAAGRSHLADFNGDGLLDFAAARSVPGREESSLRIALGDGQGGFDINQTIVIPFRGVHCLTSADFNADGAVDLAVAAHDSYNAWLLFNSGQGGLSLAPQPLAMHTGAHPHTHSLIAADMNGDGLADLLAGCADDNAIAVQLQQPGGGFAPAAGSPYAVGNHPYENLSIADFNGDNLADAAVPNMLGATLSVLLGDGNGVLRMADAGTLGTSDRPGYLACGDLDGDGALDIVATHDDVGLLTAYYGDGEGGFTPADGAPMALPGRPWCVAIADLDGDDAAEMVAAQIGGELLIYPGGRYASQLPEPMTVPVSGGELLYFALADLNRDGKLDVLASFGDNSNGAVLLQQ